MKKILIILLLFLLVGCKGEEKTFEDDYPSMKDVENVFKKVDFNFAFDFIQNQTGIILFAYNSNQYNCPYCHTVIPILNEVAINEEIGVIYYLDIYDMRTSNTKQYQSLLKYLDSKVDDLIVKDDKKAIIVPDVYFVQEGEIIGHHIATIKDENDKFIVSLNDDQQLQLKMIYQNYITDFE